MKTYLDQLKFILENGERRENRTGIDTIAVFGMQAKYDLREGFPLVTTKKVNFGWIVRELLWLIRGDTNIAGLEDAAPIWKPWADEHGNLGPVYGHQFRRWQTFGEDVELVNIRDADLSDWKPAPYERLAPTNDDEMCGTRHLANCGTYFQVISKVRIDGERNSHYLCQFEDEVGFTAVVSRPAIRAGNFGNPYMKSVRGVGFYGEADHKIDEKVYTLWRNMIVRCYDRAHKHYSLYGGRGVTVHARWHCLVEFAKDLSQIPFYDQWAKNPTAFHLDKDYYGSNQYGPKTCIFADSRTNKGLQDYAIEFDGNIFATISDCADFLSSQPQYMSIDKRRISDHLNGIKRLDLDIKKIDHPKGKLYRKRRVIDQLANVIDRIKTNPNCRRLIVTAWNPADLNKMALAPCHCFFHFSVTNTGRLDMLMYQRSCDFPVGVPFNIASYALLLKMVAQECKLEAGIFTHSMGDAHIYVNQLDGVHEQLARRPGKLPTVKIADKPFFDIKYEDFELIDYEHQGFIKYPVAV